MSTALAVTSTSPTVRATWTRARAPLAVLAALVASTVLLALLRSPGGGPPLDPRSYAPEGSRALAALLEDGGVAVRVVTDLPALQAEVGPASTVLVPAPNGLTDDELRALGGLAADVVVVGAAPPHLEPLGVAAEVLPAVLDTRPPVCDLPAAQRAGAAEVGDLTYTARDGGTACYPTPTGAGLLALPAERLALLGTGTPLTNDALDEEGSAALAVGLLGGGDEVLWLLPSPDRPGAGERREIGDLLPPAVPFAAVQLAVAVAVLAVARARRLGRVVPEPLPVVVRAAEAVEGRARLYRAAGARDTAAEALRSGARERLARRHGLGRTPGAAELVAVVAARAGHEPAAVERLLYGPPPDDDRGLVALAEALDGLSPDAPPPPTDRSGSAGPPPHEESPA